MKRFEHQDLDNADYRGVEIAAGIMRVVLFPVMLVYRLYKWTYSEKE